MQYFHYNYRQNTCISSPCDSNGPIVHLLHDDEIVSCYREQAVKDWETFLLHRTKELVPGLISILFHIPYTRRS